MSTLIDKADTELASVFTISRHTGQQLLDRLEAYENALIKIAFQPEPATRQIARDVLAENSE